MDQTSSAPRVGTARVVDRRGRVYVGIASFDGTSITLVGHRRERPWHTTTGPAETRYPVSRTWPIGRVDHIDWTDDPEAAV
jgi:hypothetical protein